MKLKVYEFRGPLFDEFRTSFENTQLPSCSFKAN